jgi:hypothetical protein
MLAGGEAEVGCVVDFLPLFAPPLVPFSVDVLARARFLPFFVGTSAFFSLHACRIASFPPIEVRYSFKIFEAVSLDV